MLVKRVLTIIAISFLILTGCSNNGNGQVSVDDVATLVSQAISTTTGNGGIIADTPVPPTQSAPLPTNTTLPAENVSILITSIQETAPGRAIVSWDSIGEFPSGYKVVWTTEEKNPTFPEDTSAYASDPFARSAMIGGTAGNIYFIRVCRVVNDNCDVYSNLGIFAFVNTYPTVTSTAAKLTPFPTISTGGGGGGGVTATAGTPQPGGTLLITGMSGGTTGKAYMTWESATDPAEGFMIFYSKTNKEPALGKDAYFFIEDKKLRSAYVEGLGETLYYYRICRYDGKTCTAYSPSFAYTFPESSFTPEPDPAVINITNITNLTTGQAKVTWTASGSFPKGFQILYSKRSSKPTMSDKSVRIREGSDRSGIVNGDPGATYYFRVCKILFGECVAYSPVETFTFLPAP